MSVFDGWRYRVHVWLNREQYDRDADEEARQHLALDAAQHRGANVGNAEAERLARRRFGNVTYLSEERRRAAGLHLLDGVALDGRHLARSLRRTPGFAIITVLTLALGIGITTAVVSVADHVMLRSLPFRDAGRLMMMLEMDAHGGFRAPSSPTAADWQRDAGTARAFEGIAFIRGDGVTLRVGDDSESVGAGFVGPDFFPVLGARPLLGRVLGDDDLRAGAPPAAVISYRLWRRRFAGDPGIIGRSISLDSVSTTVIGVLPVGAVYPGFADVWQSVAQYKRQDILKQRALHADSRTLARLRPGVDSARAMAFMRSAARRLQSEYPAEQGGWAPALFPVQQEILNGVEPMLLTLAGAAAAVLLLACANVANLLIARVATRNRELAVRGALGASRGRIVRQLVTESLLLAVGGGVLGTAVAALVVNLAKKRMAERLPRADELVVDHRVVLVAAAACVLTALLCGIWPALRATRARIGDALRAGALGSVGGRAESRMRRALVTLQFALALMLLVGAGLLMQSFRRAAAVPVGFDPHGVLAFRIATPKGYDQPNEAAALYARLMDAARSQPGVIEAAFINHSPFGGAAITTSLEIEGRPMLDSSNQVFYRTVSESYYRTMRMSLLGGRWFGESDMRSPGGLFVVNEAMAKLYWPGANAVGQRITVRRSSQARRDFGQLLPGTIIGVVANVYQTRQDRAPDPEVYVPYTLETWPWGMLMVRTRDGMRSAASLARAVASVEPRLITGGGGPASAAAASEFGDMEEVIASTLQPRKLSMAIIAAFALCALALAAIGMYGVVAYGIAQRTREIGVRKALGASDSSILTQLLGETLRVTVVGIAAGCAGAWAAARLIRGLLFDTGLADPGTYVLTIALLATAALLATLIPARRAIRLDPTIAMRGE